MKLNSWLFLTAALCSPALDAQVSLPAVPTSPVSVDAGPHHRTWQTVKVQLDERGKQVAVTNSYVELATGMNVWSETEGKWVAASDEIALADGGAIAARTQHKVVFLPNLNDRQPPISMFLPDGKPLRSQIVGLAYTERDTGRSVFISELKDSVGQVVGRNQVIYPDAFESIKADVRYTVAPSFFEQDVILREQLPSPEKMGLNPKTARLEVWTEFFDTPAPEKSTGTILRNDGEADRDDSLNFGTMQMIGGKSFSLDGETTAGGLEPLRDNGLQNAREWQVIEGRTFLIESVPHADIQPAIDALPAARVAWKMNAQSKDRLAAIAQPGNRRKPISVAQSNPAPGPSPSGSEPARMVAAAKPPARQPGVVLDYIFVNNTQTNFTFKGDTTYYATNYVSLFETTTLEGGAIAKGIQWDGGPYTGTFFVYGAFDCRTSPYRPAIFTAADDDTVGEVISGSTGTPTNYYRGSLWFDTTNSVVLENVHVRYAVSGCAIKSGTSPTLRHLQFVRCATALEKFRDNCSFQNILIDKGYLAIRGWATTLTAEHLTVNGTTYFFDSHTNANYLTESTLAVTNSLLIGVLDVDSYTSNSNGTNSSASATFQAVGAGNSYLLPNSPYSNFGTTNINPKLLADLKVRTTYPPIVLSNDFTLATTLAPQAQRDTDTPDLGYHFDPLDYCWSGLTLTNATLTLTNGVAVAIYGTNGLALQSGASLVSEGSPTTLNRLVRYDTTQEQPILWGTTGTNASLLTVVGSSPLPEVRLRFIDVSLLMDSSAKRHLVQLNGSRLANLSLTDSQLRGVYADVYSTTGTGMTVGLTNNLVERSELSFYQTNISGYYPLTLNLYNNLFLNSTVALNYRDTSTIWTVKDNLFDSVTLTEGTSTITNSNNAYKGTTQLTGGTNNVTLTTTDYKAGPLGRFYYPTSGTNLFTLVDAGSRSADQAGLYHYTSIISQAKETNSLVDIGYHYAALWPSDDGLVGWWKLDESSGTLAADSSGNGHAGTLLNGPTWTTGPVIGALNLDGTNDQVTIADAADLRIAGDITIAFWTKKNAEATLLSCLVGKANSSVRNYGIWEEAGTSKRLLFQQLTSGGQGINLWTTTTLEVGTWYHVAAVVRGTNAYFYINGTLDSSGTRSVAAPTTTDPVTFGYSGWNDHYPGVLDEVRIYNRALSADEIAGLASLGNGRPWDTDGDGIADYFEDRNGNGSVDSGETDWQSATDFGLKVWITEPKSNSDIP